MLNLASDDRQAISLLISETIEQIMFFRDDILRIILNYEKI